MADFCVIGAAKAGTTSLNQYLDQHPDVFMCPLKEPHYFSADAIFAKGPQWYRGLYRDAAPGQICGEASTSYARFPDGAETPRRIHEANPQMRLVYIVREPVARVESDCLQTMKYARFVAGETHIPDNADDMLDYLSEQGRSMRTLPVENSEYMIQIERYLEYFNRDQLLVILMEDLKAEPHETLAKVFAHIGADPSFRPDITKKLNRTEDFVESVKTEKALGAYKRFPLAKALRSIAPKGLRAKIKAALVSREKGDDLSLSPERAAALKTRFRPHNARLAEFLNRDLSHWDA